ncbi:MAG: NUDIX hydrolase [Patescibacteria group bacterium]|nr:NUDIX hydrolase [Patescibacteria group bacterium]
MFLSKPPENFNPIEVVGCSVEHNGEILLLLRQDHKIAPNQWGEPAGKVESGENKFEAMARELYEETGILKNREDIIFKATFFFRHEHEDLIYHSFVLRLNKKPKVKIDNSCHKEYKWITKKEALNLDLVHDLNFLINKYS